MDRLSRSSSSRHWLFLTLLLALGPLQAQVAFACEMMGTVVQDDCCCVEAGNTGPDATGKALDARTGGEPCCERSVGVAIDGLGSQDTPALHAGEVRSGLDPPNAAIAPPAPFPTLARPAGSSRAALRGAATRTGTPLYLTTLRLRI